MATERPPGSRAPVGRERSERGRSPRASPTSGPWTRCSEGAPLVGWRPSDRQGAGRRWGASGASGGASPGHHRPAAPGRGVARARRWSDGVGEAIRAGGAPACDSWRMANQGPEELRGFGLDARRAVALAETEARGLRHVRVGTEHLLIGLLAVEGSPASDRLVAAGANINAIRRKVAEAVAQGNPATIEVLPRSERAVRAIGRAARFSQAAGATTIGSEHLLLGVLDVEGLAGQILRGLGIDVGRLRASLLDPSVPPPEPPADPAGAAEASAGRTGPAGARVTPSGPFSPLAVTCPGCAVELDDTVTYKVLIAHGSRGPREVLVLSCGNCSR